MFPKFFIVSLLVGLSGVAHSQQEPIPTPSLANYARFEVRPVKTVTRVHPAVYGKFSAAVTKYLDTYLTQWAAADRENRPGRHLAFEITLVDAKFVSGQKRFWVGPLAGSSHIGATVELIDEGSRDVIAREHFTQAAGAMAGTFTVGASDNRMITALAEKVANYIIAAYRLRPATTQDPAGQIMQVSNSETSTDAAEVGSDETKADYYSELLKLEDLKKRGILTEEEFRKEKARILSAPH